MFRHIVFISLLAAVVAFSNPIAFTRPRLATRTFMFSGDTDTQREDATVNAVPSDVSSKDALESPIVSESSSLEASPETKGMVLKNLAKGGEVIEVKWRDPALEANISPFQMDWWAYIFVAFPFIILANDFFHFLPKEAPLSFLGRM